MKNYGYGLLIIVFAAIILPAKAQKSIYIGKIKDVAAIYLRNAAKPAVKGGVQLDALVKYLLPNKKQLVLKINTTRKEGNANVFYGEVYNTPKSNFNLKITEGEVSGAVIMLNQKKYFRYTSSPGGLVYLTEEDIDKLLCVGFKEKQRQLPAATQTIPLAVTVPALQSLPGANAVLYLDFDGQTVTNTLWNSNFNSGNPIVAEPANLSETEMTEVWKLMSEDYRPFNLNVTTSESVFNNAPIDHRMRVIFTPTNYFYTGAGGVAYIGSFTWGTSRGAETPCWVWNTTSKYAGEAGSHEGGHTLNLLHDGRTSPPESYFLGQQSWCPIMGAGYYVPVVQWSKGEYPFANNQEDDLAKISTLNGFGYRPDDYGDDIGSATTLWEGTENLNKGVISTQSDVDVFTFSVPGGSVIINASPDPDFPDLDILLTLRDAANNIVATADPSGMDASLNVTLAAGRYYLFVEGTKGALGANSDYASLGAYSIFFSKYCLPFYASGCTENDFIDNFSFNTLVNNNSGCGGGNRNGYSTYPATGSYTTSVNRGKSYTMKMQSGAAFSEGFGVWIDYNNDKDFDDSGEFVYASPTAGTSLFTATIQIPSSATRGAKRMRVRCAYNTVINKTQSCTAFDYGETEDYTIVINTPPTVSITSPGKDSVFTAPAAINITANAADVDGTITRVEFFAGAVKLGEVESAPYTYTWSNVPIGKYLLTAKATDNTGITTTSATVPVQVVYSPLIFTTAGNGTGGFSGDGLPAIQAQLNAPSGVTADKAGNVYIADTKNHRIRKVSPSGVIISIAGTGTAGFSGDGALATSAQLNTPFSVAVDNSGNVYIADRLNQRIRKINRAGYISTFAGNGTEGSSGDGGAASSARLASPRGVALDKWGNVYIADYYNNKIRKVDTTGIISTIAGIGSSGFSGDGGQATSAQLNGSTSVAVDSSGNVYIADQFNNRIRKVDTFGIINTVAGSSNTYGFSGDGGPAVNAQLAFPRGITIKANKELVIADYGNHRVRKIDTAGIINTIAGNGTSGYAGDGGPAIYAELSSPSTAAVDLAGNVYIVEENNNTVRKVILNTPPTVAISSPVNGAVFTPPATINILAGAADDDGTIVKVEFFKDTTKLGEDLTAPYAYSWKGVAAGNYSLTARATDNSGLVSNSKAISVSVVVPPNKAPVVNITNPVNNTIYSAPASITLNAAAGDEDGSIAYVQFYRGSTLIKTDSTSPYTFTLDSLATGNYSFIAKAADNKGLISNSATVAVFVSAPTNNIAPVVNMITPVNNAIYIAPATITLNAAASDADGSVTSVKFYNGSILLKTDSTSPYNVTLNNVAAGSYKFYAKATDNNGLANSSATVTVFVVPGAINKAPVISLTAPANNATYNSPATVALKAAAGDADGSITRVQFYNGATLLKTDSTSPYSYTLNNLAAGNYLFFAKATDDGGLVSNSATVAVSVSAGTNKAPLVSITGPVNNATYVTPATITLSADASDLDGSITSVKFYNGATLLKTDSASPYTYTLSNVAAGTYTFSAKATDNIGSANSSATVTTFVVPNATNKAPIVNIASPDNNTLYNAPASITLNADASDPDGTITSVQFYNNGTLLSTATTSPYSYTLNNLAVGNYSFIVKATDNNGLTSNSATVTIVVSASPAPNKAPVVAITSPETNAVYTVPATIMLTATATDPDGSIANVKFYNGATLLKTLNTGPYSYTMNNVPAGNYKFYAKATDKKGSSNSSATAYVVVTALSTNTATAAKGQIVTPSPVNVIPEANNGPVSLKLAPNPAHNILNIYTTGLQQGKQTTLSVIAASGVIVKSMRPGGSNQMIRLNVSSLTKGTYIIKIVNGDKIIYRQFIKM